MIWKGFEKERERERAVLLLFRYLFAYRQVSESTKGLYKKKEAIIQLSRELRLPFDRVLTVIKCVNVKGIQAERCAQMDSSSAEKVCL